MPRQPKRDLKYDARYYLPHLVPWEQLSHEQQRQIQGQWPSKTEKEFAKYRWSFDVRPDHERVDPNGRKYDPWFGFDSQDRPVLFAAWQEIDPGELEKYCEAREIASVVISIPTNLAFLLLPLIRRDAAREMENAERMSQQHNYEKHKRLSEEATEYADALERKARRFAQECKPKLGIKMNAAFAERFVHILQDFVKRNPESKTLSAIRKCESDLSKAIKAWHAEHDIPD